MVTDGDIRRSLLNNVNINEKISLIMNHNYIFVEKTTPVKLIKNLFETKLINQIPVIDKNLHLIDVLDYRHYDDKKVQNTPVIILAGGEGRRLAELTQNTPKPMLKIGNSKPLLEIIIEQLKSYGFTNIHISVNYLKNVIQDYFQNGEKFGVNIKYIHEPIKMGTVGSIKLIQEQLTQPFIVINGDVLTKLNIEQLLNFHNQNKNIITVCTKKTETNVQYGVLKLEGNIIVDFEEKPKISNMINAGIYCLNPEIINSIPDNTYFDMVDLIKIYLKSKQILSFPITEFWLDVGSLESLRIADEKYLDIFGGINEIRE